MILTKTGLRLLIVDDELGMRDMLTLELEGKGYQVTTVTNGMEALEKIRSQKFDLVITDLKMPQMNGMNLLENIKNQDPQLVVIMATGHGTIESAVEAIKKGAYDYILKPYTLDQLNRLIERALEHKNLKATVAAQSALAVQNAKLYQDLQEAYHKLENTQTELLQSEKLASIGRLVAGVAHELNNPLTAVIGYSELASESQSLEEIHRQLPIISSEAQRCSRIVKDLLIFSRKQKPRCEPINPGLLLDEILKGISLELHKREIAVKIDLTKAPLVIKGDPELLKQVFLNIIANAYQALEEITGERKIEVMAESMKDKIRFTFVDNGPGIPKESIHKIFDPFYTTKEVGKGTGLGLSLTYGIIKEHGGTIFVDSEPGKGTAFKVDLPLTASSEEPSSKTVEPANDTQLKLNPKTQILIVEDEEPIRILISKIFKNQQYETEAVSDGQAACERLRNKEYDLVLCDYRMPKLNGVDFYEQTVKKQPRYKGRFLFVTGSIEFMKNSESYFKERQVEFLLKPFTKEQLISAVNTVIQNLKTIV